MNAGALEAVILTHTPPWEGYIYLFHESLEVVNFWCLLLGDCFLGIRCSLSVMFSSFQFWQAPITWTLRMGHLMSSWSLLAMETSLPWSPVLYPALEKSFLPYPSDKRCFVRVCVGSCTQGVFFCTVDKGFSSILSVATMALCLHLKWQSLLFLPLVYIALLLF